MNFWVIYFDPSDFPGRYVLRRHIISDTLPPYADTHCTVRNTLEGVRKAVPGGSFNAGRHPLDDPKIVEVWI